MKRKSNNHFLWYHEGTGKEIIMMEKIFDLMVEGQDVEEIIDELQAQNILRDGSEGMLRAGAAADQEEYNRRMNLAASRLDSYMEQTMTREHSIVATGLSADYEYEARLNGFVMGFRAALQLMGYSDPETK